MASRGTIAKENVIKTLQTAFGDKFIGEYDKKIFVWADDGGQQVQIAISMTCPKTFIETDNAPMPAIKNGGFDFESVSTKPAQKIDISKEEQDRIAEMMARLGL